MANLIDLKKDNVMKKIEIKELIKGEVAEQMAEKADPPKKPITGLNVASSLGNLLN